MTRIDKIGFTARNNGTRLMTPRPSPRKAAGLLFQHTFFFLPSLKGITSRALGCDVVIATRGRR
jgi:hypothetical protein